MSPPRVMNDRLGAAGVGNQFFVTLSYTQPDLPIAWKLEFIT